MGTCRTFFMKPENLGAPLFIVLKHTVKGIILSHLHFTLKDNPVEKKQSDFVGPLMGMNWTIGGEYRNGPSQIS